MERAGTFVLVSILLLILLAETLFWVSVNLGKNLNPKLDININSIEEEDAVLYVNISYSYATCVRSKLFIVGVIVSDYHQTPNSLPIHIFYSNSYPCAGVSRNGWYAFATRLKWELNQRKLNASISSAQDLQACVNSPSILVLPNGILPDTIYDGSPDDKLSTWLTSGGIMIWLGDQNPAYVGHYDGSWSSVNATGCLKQGPSFKSFPREATYTMNATSFAKQLALHYRTNKAIEVTENSTSLGFETYDGERYTTISFIPQFIGDGRLLLFGQGYSDNLNGMDDFEVTAYDTAQIIWSGILFGNHAKVTPLLVRDISGIGEFSTRVDMTAFGLSIENCFFVLLAYSTLSFELPVSFARAIEPDIV